MNKLLAGGLAALVASALAPAAGASPTASLSPAGDARFPERAFLLTLKERTRLDRSRVSITENGGPVRHLSVQGVGAARRSRLGVVLAMDASDSMRGRPLAGALDAARAFVAQRQENQPLALVTFNGQARTALPFTTSAQAIESALSRPPQVRRGTHLYDATRTAVEQVRRAHMRSGFVVVLSDGADRGSSVTGAQTAATARAAGVRIYTVGLRSGSFDPRALEGLASATGGKYSEASSAAELRSIYSALGSELSRGYLVRYRSLAGPGVRVDVRARVRRVGSAASSYTTPRLGSDAEQPAGRGAWSSPLAVVGASIVVALLLALALVALLSGRRQTVRERIAEFVDDGGDAPGREGLMARFIAQIERRMGGTRWWAKLEQELDIAGFTWSVGRVVVASAGAAIAAGVLLAAGTAQPALGLAAVVLVAPILWMVVRSKARRTRRAFDSQLGDHLAMVAGAMRAGHSLAAAMAAVVDDAPEPTRREFRRAETDVKLGAALEDALDRVAKRMRSRDVEQVAVLAVVQREAGSNTAEMLNRVVETVRERQELRGMVRTLTAQGRLSRWILSLLPLAVLLFLTVINPTFMDPLYKTSAGHVLMAVAAAMVVAGSLIIKRIVEFEI